MNKFAASLAKRKFLVTAFCTLFGAVVAFTTGASLNDWTFFAATMIGVFGAADVADKKLNGGKYDERTPGSPAGQPGENDRGSVP